MKTPVYVAGIGVISAIGKNVPETAMSFKTAATGIKPLTLFDSVHRGSLPVGEVSATTETLANQLGVQPHLPRTALLGIQAAREAVKQAGINLSDWRTALVCGTTVGGMDSTEKFFVDFMNDTGTGKLRDVVHHACGSVTEVIADDLGIHDFISTINTACSSSVNSIAFGARLLQQGIVDVALVGGTDALTKFTLNGFNSLLILDSALCRPFDATRSGLNLGEGAGFLLLISERVRATGISANITVSGFANTNDAFHQTASSPEGRGSFAAMEKALAMAQLAPADIDYLNLHGTGTQNNDLSEGTAVKRLFGENYPRLSSTKAFTGHTLGASGGIEAVFSIMALQQQCAFPNLRFAEAMPELGIVPQCTFEEGLRINHVMSNSFGFGGNCSSIIFSHKG